MAANRRLMKELSDFAKAGVQGVKVEARGGNMQLWDVIIDGPAGTPYEGGHFKAELTFPPDYPMKPPTMKFCTKIYHPNIQEDGHACIQSLNKWAPSVMMKRVLEDLIHILANPDGTQAVNENVGVQFMQDRAAFEQQARQYTREYAK